MLRHLAASWLFAGFLVVVAVATWRVLDARPPAPPAPPQPPLAAAVAVAMPVPIVVEPLAPAPAPPPEVTSCGAAFDPFDSARADSAEHDVSPLQLGSQPFADTIIDGKHYGSTPFYGPRRLTLELGVHEVELRDKVSDKSHRYRLHIKAADPENKVIVVLTDHGERVRATGAVQMTLLDMTEAQAQQVFSDAVDALRDKRTARGCDLLDSIVERTSSTFRWNEKAANLYSRRCD